MSEGGSADKVRGGGGSHDKANIAEWPTEFDYRTLFVPVVTGWATSLVNGVYADNPLYHRLNTTVAANSSASASAEANLLSVDDAEARLDFDKKIVLAFDIARTNSDAEAEAWCQLKQAIGIGDLAEKGFGIKIKNLALWGCAYDVAREEVDLGVSLVSGETKRIIIVHVPGVGVEFYINGVLCGRSTKEPSGLAGAACYFVSSIQNGATGTVDDILTQSPIQVHAEI